MSSFLIVLALLAVFIVRGVAAEKKRAEEAQRKAAAQGAAGQRPAYSPPVRPATRAPGPDAHTAKPTEWDAYGNPLKPRPAAQRSAAPSPARPAGPEVRSSTQNSQPARPLQRDAYGNPIIPSAVPASGSMTYVSMEGVGSMEGMAVNAPSNAPTSMEGMASQEGTSAYAPSHAIFADSEHQPLAHHTRYALNRTNARQALIYSEILGKPKALRR